MSTEMQTSPENSRSHLLPLIGLILVAASLSLIGIGQGGWIDDSFISFRYARYLVDGFGLVYNAGIPVEGYSNFLWTLIASLGIALDVEPIYFTQGVALLAQAATLWILHAIGRAAGHSGWQALIAPLLLAGSVGFIEYPMTGMETSLFIMLVSLSFWLLRLERYASTLGAYALGISMLAMATTRFDGFVPAILLLSYPLLFQRREGADLRTIRNTKHVRPILKRSIVILVVGLLVYNLWRVWFYGNLLPNTFHAKTSFSIDRIRIGLHHLQSFATGVGGLLLGLGALAFLTRRPSSMARALGWVVLGQAGYVAVVGGDWMPHHRFLLPVLPLLCALAQEGCLSLVKRFPLPRALSVGAVAALVLVICIPTAQRIAAGDAPTGSHFDTKDAKRIGEYLATELPRDKFLAVEWGGIIPYYVPHRTLDTWGLTDKHIVQQQFPRYVWGRKITPEYLARRRPDLIAGNARLLPTEAEALASVQPGGVNDYSHYPRMATPEMGYRWNVFKIGEGAYWPALVRR